MANRSALHWLCGIALAMLGAAAQAAPFAYIPRANVLTVIDLQSEQVVANIGLPGTPVTLAARPGARYVYVGNGFDRVWAIDTVPHAIVGTIELPQPDAIAIDPISPRAFVLTGCAPLPCPPSIEARITPINSNSLSRGATRSVAGIAASRMEFIQGLGGGLRLALSGGNRVMTVDPDNLLLHANFTVPGTAGGMTSMPGSFEPMFVAVDQGSAGGAYIHPSTQLAVAGAGAMDLVTNLQGTRLYVANNQANTVTVIDAVTGVRDFDIPVGRGPMAIDISPAGDKLYVLNAIDSTVSLISTASHTVTKTITVAGPIIKPRGRFIGGVALTDGVGVLSGLWWNEREPGWGLHLTHRVNTIFAAWFTYDAAGERKWYVASACLLTPLTCPVCVDNVYCDGNLFEMTGPRYFRDPFDTALVRPVFTGTMRINFRNRNEATFNYTLGSQSASVPITRQIFRTSGIAPVIDYTDLWWNPRESGWGIGVTQQFGVMFVTWYVYDDAGRPVWYVASNCVVQPGGNGCTGTLYRTTGPAGPVSGQPFDPAAVRILESGSITLTFTDPNNGLLSYEVGSLRGFKGITRQTF